VILNVRYTAREGGRTLRDRSLAELPEQLAELPISDGRQGLFRMLSARHDFPDAWQALLADTGDTPTLTLPVGTDRLPFVFQGRDPRVDAVAVAVNLADRRTTDGRTIAEAYQQGSALTLALAGTAGPAPELRSDPGVLQGDPPARFAVSLPLAPEPTRMRLSFKRDEVQRLHPALRTADGRLDPTIVRDVVVILHYRTAEPA
jgi:hypothetical protein